MELLNVSTKNVTPLNELVCIGIDGVVPHLQNDLNLRFNANDMYCRHRQNTHERIFVKSFRKPKRLPTHNGSNVNAVWGMCDMRRFNFDRNLFVRDNLLSTMPQTPMGSSSCISDIIYSRFNGYSGSGGGGVYGTSNGNSIIKFKDNCVLHVNGEVCSEVSLFERRIFARFKITAQYDNEPIRTTDLKLQLPEYMFSMLPSPLTLSNYQKSTACANRTVDETVFYTSLQLMFDNCEYKFIVGFVNDTQNCLSDVVTKIMVRCQTPTSSYAFMKCAEMIYRFYDRMDVIHLFQQPYESQTHSSTTTAVASVVPLTLASFTTSFVNGTVSPTSSSSSVSSSSSLSSDIVRNGGTNNNVSAHEPGIWSTFKWNVHGANRWEFGECRPITPKLENFLELLVISEVARAFHQTMPVTRIHPDVKIYTRTEQNSSHYSVFNILPALCTSVLLFVGPRTDPTPVNGNGSSDRVKTKDPAIGGSNCGNSSFRNGYK